MTTLDLRELMRVEDPVAVLLEKLKAPAWASPNLDALYDVLTDPEFQGTLTLRGPIPPEPGVRRILQVLDLAARENPGFTLAWTALEDGPRERPD